MRFYPVNNSILSSLKSLSLIGNNTHNSPHAWRFFSPGPPVKHTLRQPITANVDLREILKRQAGPKGFRVIEFLPAQGKSPPLARDKKNPVSPHTLGIHQRDMALFISSKQSSKLSSPWGSATFAIRDSTIILVTEAVRAIISADKVVLLKSRSEKENQNIIAPMLQAINNHDLPFELCAIEVLLNATTRYFERRIAHLAWMLDIVHQDLQQSGSDEPFTAVTSETTIRQLAPLEKALNAVRNDAKETCAALGSILSHEDMVASVCLTELKNLQNKAMSQDFSDAGDFWSGPGPAREDDFVSFEDAIRVSGKEITTLGGKRGDQDLRPSQMVTRLTMRQAERMLQSYERAMESCEATLTEMSENLDTMRDSWRMKMDSARNSMMLINISLSMMSISLMVAAFLPTAFGMNIKHGMEDTMGAFYVTTVGSVVLGICSFPYMLLTYRRYWAKQNERDANKVNRLRVVLLNHLDDLDDIVDAASKMPGKVDRAAFGLELKRLLPRLFLSSEAIEFLFNQFDINGDGMFEPSELMKSSANELEALGKAPTPSNVRSQMIKKMDGLKDLVSHDEEDCGHYD